MKPEQLKAMVEPHLEPEVAKQINWTGLLAKLPQILALILSAGAQTVPPEAQTKSPMKK